MADSAVAPNRLDRASVNAADPVAMWRRGLDVLASSSTGLRKTPEPHRGSFRWRRAILIECHSRSRRREHGPSAEFVCTKTLCLL